MHEDPVVSPRHLISINDPLSSIASPGQDLLFDIAVELFCAPTLGVDYFRTLKSRINVVSNLYAATRSACLFLCGCDQPFVEFVLFRMGDDNVVSELG